MLVPLDVGQDSAAKWGTITDMGGAIPLKWGNLVGIAPSTVGRIIPGDDGSATPAPAGAAELRFCNQRFSNSSILRRTCSP